MRAEKPCLRRRGRRLLEGWRTCPVCGEPTLMTDEGARADHALYDRLQAQAGKERGPRRVERRPLAVVV